MTLTSKKQLGTTILFLFFVSALMGAVLMADHSLELEEIGSYLPVIGGILGTAGAIRMRSAKQCPEHVEA